MSNRGMGRASATRSERRRAEVARRRRTARQAAASVGRRERNRRRRRIALLTGGPIAVAVVVAGIVVFTRDDSTPGVTSVLTSPVLSDGGEVLAIDDVLDSYRLRYRIDTTGTDGVTSRIEDILVRRPFDARLTVYPGVEATGTPDVDAISTLGLYGYLTSSEVGAGLPAMAIGDLRLDGVLDDLVGAGLFVARERREVAGRECQVYRTGLTLERLELAAPTETDYADACVDAAGLVLEEVAVVAGDAAFYEIALEVDAVPEVTGDEFAIDGEPIAVEDGGNELVELPTEVAPAAGYWAPPAPPDGYEHVGRYTLRSLAPEDTSTATTVGAGPAATVETYVDVYQDGSSFVIVHQGAAAQSPGRDTTIGADVEAGALGPARVAYGLSGSTLVVTTDTWFVEITAPMSAADLGTLASTFVAAG